MENIKEIAINKESFDPKKILFIFMMLFALLLITINVNALKPFMDNYQGSRRTRI